jgi:Ca2+-binding EF-hand superfamily protein
MASEAHALLLDLVAKLRAVLANQANAGHTGSFEDINAFVAFRKASGVPRGMPIDILAFKTVLTNLGVAHTEKLASKAFRILLSMDGTHTLTNPNTDLAFRHFHKFQIWVDKRRDMQDRLNLSTTRVHKMEGELGALTNLLSRREEKKVQAKADAEAKMLTSRIQLTGRSLSASARRRQKNPLIHDKKPKVKAIARHTSHAMLYDKMEAKYKSLRKAFRAIDENGDQKVSWPELQRLLVTFNMDPNDRALHQLFTAADIDNSGEIEYPEFQSHFGELLQPSTAGGSAEQTLHGKIRSGGMGLHNRLHGVKEKTSRTKQSGLLQAQEKKKKTKKKRSNGLAATSAAASRGQFMSKMQAKFSSLRGAFRWINEDADGEVTWAELQRLLRNFNMDEENPVLLQLFRLADANGDGSIDYQEFQRYFGELIQPNTGGGHENDLLDGIDNKYVMSVKKPKKREHSTRPAIVPGLDMKMADPPNTNIKGTAAAAAAAAAVTATPTTTTGTTNKSLSSSALLVSNQPSAMDLMQEKLLDAVQGQDWRKLHQALRRADRSRSGTLERGVFAVILMEFGIALSLEELNFISSTMGTTRGSTSRSQMGMTQTGTKRRRPRPSSALLGHRAPAMTWGNSLRHLHTRSGGLPSSRGLAGNRPMSALVKNRKRPMSALSRGCSSGTMRTTTMKTTSRRARRIKYPEFMKNYVIQQSKSASRTQRLGTDTALLAITTEFKDLLA